MLDLDKRLTHTYVGTYQYLDKWERIGSYEELGKSELPQSEEDEQDPCDPRAALYFVQVTSEASDEDIRSALHDSYSSWGCAHEYDCCGCWSFRASSIKRRTGDVWELIVHASRNY